MISLSNATRTMLCVYCSRSRPGISSPPQTYFHLFMAWSKSFKGYYREDVKAMYNWWTQLEEWCEANAPAVLATLNPPALESDIKAATQAYRSLLLNSEDNATFPYMLRLMYRFHNGQASLYDRHTPPVSLICLNLTNAVQR